MADNTEESKKAEQGKEETAQAEEKKAE